MTAQVGEEPNSSVNTLALADDEIDFRQLIQTLIDWWREIFLIVLLAAVSTAVIVYILEQLDTPVYEAASTVAIARIISDISFDERYRTISDETLAIQQSNSNARRASLLRLVSIGTIAERVAAELPSILSPAEAETATLIKMVDASVATGSTDRIQSDLIRISVTANSPEKAAAIADSWAKHYVEHVNSLYGQVPPEVIQSVEDEFVVAEEGYQAAQRNLESFISTNQVRALQRQIDEKQGIIDSLQAGKQTAIDTIVEEELNARRQIISAYINSLAANRLLGFQKEQQSKRQVINAYLDAELTNRLAAIEEDRRLRETLFQESTNAQISAVTAIIQQETKGQVDLLHQSYRTRLELNKLLDQAQILRSQIQEAGDQGAATNGSALILLKAQLASLTTTSEPLSTQLEILSFDELKDGTQVQDISPIVNNLQGTDASNRFNIDIGQPIAADADAQLVDVTAFINAIEAQLSTIDAKIVELADGLAEGSSYQPDSLNPENLGATQAMEDETATDTENATSNLPLSDSIVERYKDLFGVGSLAQINSSLVIESDVLAQIEALYPNLFTLEELSQLTDAVPDDSPLALVSLEKAQQLLQLQGLEDIPEYTSSAEPLIKAIDKLDSEIQLLQAQLEAERSREQQLIQQRDLAWETYTTLSNKSAELNLAQSATNSEVRLAAPAVPPVEPIPGVSLSLSTIVAGMIGLLLGIFVAFFGHFMGYEPFLRRSQPSTT